MVDRVECYFPRINLKIAQSKIVLTVHRYYFRAREENLNHPVKNSANHTQGTLRYIKKLAVKFEGNENLSIDDFDIFVCY